MVGVICGGGGLGDGRRGVKNVLSDLSELLLGPLGHSLGHVLSESVSQ